MLHSFRHLLHWIIILTLTPLAFGIEGRASLCLTSDGDVHMEQSHISCGLSEDSPAGADTAAMTSDRIDGQGHCLDVSTGNDASSHHQRSFVQLPAPAMISVVPPIILGLTDKKTFHSTPAVTPPQLLSLQSVILLI